MDPLCNLERLGKYQALGLEYFLVASSCGAVAFDPNQFQTIWNNTNITSGVQSRPAVTSEGTLAYMTEFSTVSAVDLVTGELIYRSDTDSAEFIKGLTLSLDESQLYGVSGRSGTAMIFDTNTGKFIFRGSTSATEFGPSSIAPPLTRDGKAFFALHSNRGLTRYDVDKIASEGNISQVSTWDTERGTYGVRTTPIIDANDEYIYAVTAHGEMLTKLSVASGAENVE
jgi:WD40 repeat protein